MVKIAVLAPMPSARTARIVMVNRGRFTNIRIPKRKSCQKLSNMIFHTSPTWATSLREDFGGLVITSPRPKYKGISFKCCHLNLYQKSILGTVFGGYQYRLGNKSRGSVA